MGIERTKDKKVAINDIEKATENAGGSTETLDNSADYTKCKARHLLSSYTIHRY